MFVARVGAGEALGTESAMDMRSARTRPVWFVYDGQEHRADVPIGEAMWDAVTRALAARLRQSVESAGAPRYDEGTRNWTLPLRVPRRFLGSREVMVPVRW